MEIAIKILDINGDAIALFDKDFFELQFSEFLDGVGLGQFRISTQSKMFPLLIPSNSIEIIDIQDNDRVIWIGFIRPFSVTSDTALISLSQIKDKLNYKIITSSGTITSISQALQLLGLPYILNMPDITFDGIEYRVGMRWFNILEEIRKVTDYDWDFNGEKVTFGRVGSDRKDISFWSEATPGDCKAGNILFINNIQASFVERYDKVIAYNPGIGFAIAGSGEIEVSIESNGTTIQDLQKAADEYLKLGANRRVITFDVPNIGDKKIEVGDKIHTEISGTIDIFQIQTDVRILKKEVRLENCNLLTKLFISETKVGLRDDYNILARLDSRIASLQTK